MTDPASPAKRRTAALPAFHQPTDRPSPEETDPPINLALDPTATTTLPPWSDGGAGDVQRDLEIPRLGPAATRTTTSDTSDNQVDPKLVAGLAVAILGILLTAAAVAVKRARPSRELRRPSDKTIKAFATPVSEILMRHVEITKLHPSLKNAFEAAGAVGTYLEEGPLTRPAAPNSGMPTNPQDDPNAA